MDTLTIILMLSIGSFIYGLLLIAFQYKKSNSEKIPFWVMAKFFQAVGSLILYIRSGQPDFITIMLGHNVLLLGCAYEAWAIRIISNQPVSRRFHISTSIGIILLCLLTVFSVPNRKISILFFLQSIFYFLPAAFLFAQTGVKSFLRILLGISYFIIGMIFFLSSVIFLQEALSLYKYAVYQTLPVATFCIFIISGFIMLMLAKERIDIQLQQIQKTLKRSEVQFQRIVETAIEGILTFDKDYRITFVNQNMANMLGYTPEEILGMNFVTFIPEGELDNYEKQRSNRVKGKDAVYECCLQRKDGQKNWFLVSAKATIDDYGNVDGAFAMLTDIDHRKKTELLLEESNRQLAELTKKDGLTGIANRRNFDEVLAHEYFRLKRSNSKLSIILMDIDYFKEFNDCYGHIKGDECLRQVGNILTNFTSRSVDLAARYGGEEFACILPDTDIGDAVMIAENIRQGIEVLAIPHKGSGVSNYVTASFGVTTVTYTTERSVVEILTEVDKLLYQAKSLGRNRVEFIFPNPIIPSLFSTTIV